MFGIGLLAEINHINVVVSAMLLRMVGTVTHGAFLSNGFRFIV